MDLTIAQKVGAKIRETRTSFLEITQQGLADRLGISRPSVANIESGRQQLTVEQLYEFAAVLGVDPVELLPEPSKGPGLKLPVGTKPKIQKWAEALIESHNE